MFKIIAAILLAFSADEERFPYSNIQDIRYTVGNESLTMLVQNTSGQLVAEPELVVSGNRVNNVVVGRITTADDGQVPAYQLMWYAADTVGSFGSQNGNFVVNNLIAGEPSAIEIMAAGYQARLLLEGRDYNRGDLNVQVKLLPLPYASDRSVLEQVTGLTVNQFSDYPVLQRIMKNNGRRYSDSNARLPDAASPRITILGTDNVLISSINLVRWNDTVAGVPDTRLESALTTMTIQSSPDGIYDRPSPFVWVSAEGYARFWFSYDYTEGPRMLNTLNLVPESTLRFQFRGKPDGAPVANCSVVLDPNVRVPGLFISPAVFTSTGGPNAQSPKSDERGEVFFRNLGEGNYTAYIAWPDGKRHQQDVLIGRDEDIVKVIERD